MTYAVATVYGDTDSFANVTPQPRSDGIFVAGEDIPTADGTVVESGFYFTDWEYRGAALDESEYTALLTQLGVDTAKSAAVTIRTRTVDGTFVAKNAIVTRPRNPARTLTGMQNVTFRFTWLEDVS